MVADPKSPNPASPKTWWTNASLGAFVGGLLYWIVLLAFFIPPGGGARPVAGIIGLGIHVVGFYLALKAWKNHEDRWAVYTLGMILNGGVIVCALRV